MIISASRRTDIPAFYSGWFFGSLKKGYVVVSNPFNPHQERKIRLDPSNVDGFVFWTRNPEPMIPGLHQLKDYPYYFLFTITPYGGDVEKISVNKEEIIGVFKDLSKRVGKKRVIWRYDPIIVSNKYNIDFHINSFERHVKKLYKHTSRCIISFLDVYRKNKKRLQEYNIREASRDVRYEIGKNFGRIAKKYGLAITTCAEDLNLSQFDITAGKCIDNKLLSEISGKEIRYIKDKGQREYCRCTESIDIGSYHTCKYDCIYCYAS